MPPSKGLAECLCGLGFLERKKELQKKSQWTKESKELAKILSDEVISDSSKDVHRYSFDFDKQQHFLGKATVWVEQNGPLYWSGEHRKRLCDDAPAFPEAKEKIIKFVQHFMLTKYAWSASKANKGSHVVVDRTQSDEAVDSNNRSFLQVERSNEVNLQYNQAPNDSLNFTQPTTLNLRPLHRSLTTYAYIGREQKLLDAQKSLVGFVEQQRGLGHMDSAIDVSKRAIEWVNMNGETVWAAAHGQTRRARALEVAVDRSRIVKVVEDIMHDLVSHRELNILQELRHSRFSGLASLLMGHGTDTKKRDREGILPDEDSKRAAHSRHSVEGGTVQGGSNGLGTAKWNAAELLAAFETSSSEGSSVPVQVVEGAVEADNEDGRVDLATHERQNSDRQYNALPISDTQSHQAPARQSLPILYGPISFSENRYGSIVFMVGLSPNYEGSWHPMSMREGHDAASFRAGVSSRLELLGEPLGTRKIVAKLDWIRGTIYVDTDEYHQLLFNLIETWPGWGLAKQETQCIVYLTPTS